MKTKQHGFAVLEALLIIIILGIIGGAGYYVWHSHQATDKKMAATNKTSNNSVVATSTQYVVIKEWGVRFKLPNALKSMKYELQVDEATIRESAAKSVALDSADLVHAAGGTTNCPENAGLLGIVSRRTSAIVPEEVSSSTSKIGNYYYDYYGPQEACQPVKLGPLSADGGDANHYPSSNLQNTAVQELVKLVPQTLTAL